MAITYRNWKEQLFYLHEGKTKKGNPKYFFSQESQGNLVDEIPEGYEIYENVNGQVFLRKIQPKVITDSEIEETKREIEKYPHLKYYRVGVKKNIILVYQPLQDIKGLTETFKEFGKHLTEDEAFEEIKPDYWQVMRFVLIDPVNRKFEAERMHYGGDEGWWYLETGNLNELLRKFTQHLGKESFFEL